MNAVTVIENLIKLGTIASDVAAKNSENEKFDFVAFLKGDAPKDLQDAVSAIILALKPDELTQAIDAVEEKQKALLGGKKLAELSTDKLVQYATLTDTKLLLNTARVKRAVDGDFYSWLVDGGLASIIKVAKIAIPLLV